MPKKPKSSSQAKGFTLRPLPEESSEPFEADPTIPPGNREPFDNLGELPHGYGVDTIFLIAQEPHWLFTYWDIDIARHPGGAAFLRYHLSDGTLEGEIEVPFETRNWYVPVQLSGSDYFVEIGFYRGETWNLIARSMIVTTPPEGMATSEDFDYATVPFHLSFQRMLDHLENARNSGEDLLAAVSRLQQNGDFSALGTGGLPDLLTEDQRSLLRALLGPDLIETLASNGQSSGEIEAQIRAFLQEQLGSGGGSSEFLSSFPESAALFSGGELFSAPGPLSASGSSSVRASTSWEVGALASWAAGAIASWTSPASALGSWGGATSWSAAQSVGASGELALGGLASWAGALGGSWTEAAVASWTEAVLTSWGQAATASWFASSGASEQLAGGMSSSLSSWLQGMQSSWAEAALGSWNATDFSSWSSALGNASWSGGASETLSSFGSSDAFITVDAEVTLLGTAPPATQITLGGEPISLQPDGSFRHCFIFPSSDKEISVIARSPDGVETRTATLHFRR